MKNKKVLVFDPPMCCSSGVCGPSVDTTLIKFANDIDWLKKQGVKVERYNLSSNLKEFKDNLIVKDALGKMGKDILPLILVDEKIVCQKKYPSREQLLKFVDLNPESDNNLEEVELDCAPGCNCNSTISHSGITKNIKYVIGALVILLALVMVIFQIIKAKQTNQNQTTETNYVSANQNAESTTPDINTSPTTTEQPSVNTAPNNTKQPEGKQYIIGENLNSFNDLNTMAMDKDTVFVFISANDNTPINPEIEKVIQEAVKTLNTNGIKVGIYTLSTSAPEYSEIAKQASNLPFILVSTKGKGTTIVDGTITEDKILQAYASTIKTAAEGGCCPTSPGGCG
ncbi:MAG: arsenite efflux transporter metallochaperone ArsD [Caldisericia bacterium]|nr:arsenite efflux transporter metallochaperone ArsD [Caldisericia bacterium]